MMNVTQLTNNLKSYVDYQINNVASTTPMIGFIKPLITRALDNNINKLQNTLSLLADNEGNIDVENILTEMIQNVINTQPFVLSTSFIGDIEVGGGNIKVNIPFTHKKLVFNVSDLEAFKEMIIIKK